MQQEKNLLNLHGIKELSKQDSKGLSSDCLDGLNAAIAITLELTELYLDEHIFDYCAMTNTICELEHYIQSASHKEADILIKKLHNIFEATPKNQSILKQAPISKLMDAAKKRLGEVEAYKLDNNNKTNYDFMVNTLNMERGLANAEHPFVVLSLNAGNLFTALLTLYQVNQSEAEKLADKVTAMLTKHKHHSPFFEHMYKDTAFISLEALCFDIKVKSFQKDLASTHYTKSIAC